MDQELLAAIIDMMASVNKEWVDLSDIDINTRSKVYKHLKSTLSNQFRYKCAPLISKMKKLSQKRAKNVQEEQIVNDDQGADQS